VKRTPVHIFPGDPVAFDPRHRPLFATEHWGVALYRNQTYLGRSMVYLRSRKIEDPLELEAAERDELWEEVLPALAGALRAAFAPDRINYAHLANRTNHVHWHVVPRYELEPERWFAGHRFLDNRQGMIFRTKRRGRVPPDVLEAIAAELRDHLREFSRPIR
jgi:diadenosine tetraphosphate (Ap4A) HIT family hydrolase